MRGLKNNINAYIYRSEQWEWTALLNNIIYDLENKNINFKCEELEKNIYKNPEEYFSSVKVVNFKNVDSVEERYK